MLKVLYYGNTPLPEFLKKIYKSIGWFWGGNFQNQDQSKNQNRKK